MSWRHTRQNTVVLHLDFDQSDRVAGGEAQRAKPGQDGSASKSSNGLTQLAASTSGSKRAQLLCGRDYRSVARMLSWLSRAHGA